MSKQPVQPGWFYQLRTVGLRKRLQWLAPLASSVEIIANFGCWNSSEPLALLWTLDASEVTVIEREEDHLILLKEELTTLAKTVPASLAGRSVQFVVADISQSIPGLAPNSFDLVYCEDVLYEIEMEQERVGVERAISEMVRVIKSGGWIVIVDTKIGAQMQEISNELLSTLSGRMVVEHFPATDPIDLSPFFEANGLCRVDVAEAPRWSYCYRKPFM